MTVLRQARLSWGEKLGYGFGDLGFNLYWTTIGSFLAAFYTDVFGISAAAAGTMLFVTKILDALTDPLVGAAADRTDTRFGKFRPFLILAGIPMAAAGVLTFTTPDLGDTGKLLWAYATYSMLMLLYTLLNTPYSALSGVMTASSQERTTLISVRFIFAFAGATLVNWYTLPLVKWLGRGDDIRGWQATLTLYGLVAATIFAITFLSTRERIAPPAKQKTTPVEDIADLLRNRPWLILFALAMIIMITFTMRGRLRVLLFLLLHRSTRAAADLPGMPDRRAGRRRAAHAGDDPVYREDEVTDAAADQRRHPLDRVLLRAEGHDLADLHAERPDQPVARAEGAAHLVDVRGHGRLQRMEERTTRDGDDVFGGDFLPETR